MTGSADGMVSCPSCSRQVVEGAYVCPECSTALTPVEDSWLALSTASGINDRAQHQLVPEHRLISNFEAQSILDQYDVEKTQLPYIKKSDPGLQGLPVRSGDIVEVVRDSRTTDSARVYRLVVPLNRETTRNEWKPQTTLSDGVYSPPDTLNDELARHILTNLGASVPPTRPGACSQIAVDRETELVTAMEYLDHETPYVFIEGELGFGKSFFLQWLRDELAPTSAVSIVDLDDETTFLRQGDLVSAIRRGLQTPRTLTSDRFANGVDELWATFLNAVETQTLDHLKDRQFELTEDRVKPNILSALRTIVGKLDVPSSLVDRLIMIGEANLTGERSRSFSKEFPDTEITDENARAVLQLFAELARFNGYRLILAVDELEKADRTRAHFEAIHDFIKHIPDNTTLFVTGTPELLEGGGEQVAIRGTYSPLYELSSDHLVSLDEPTRSDLKTFTERLLEVEQAAVVDTRRYHERISSFGSTTSVVQSYLEDEDPPTITFRGFVQYLRE